MSERINVSACMREKKIVILTTEQGNEGLTRTRKWGQKERRPGKNKYITEVQSKLLTENFIKKHLIPRLSQRKTHLEHLLCARK